MIIADTDILSALAKVGRMPLLLSLFNATELYITPAVFSEIEHSFDLGRQYAIDLFAMLSAGQLRIAYLTPEEVAFRDTLPVTLASGERESIAAARSRSGVVLSNESRVAHICREHHVDCLRLPDILRALWVEKVASKMDVEEIIRDLGVKDRMRFKQSTLDAILVDP
jgi:predicted nucleic acid-binding protein